MRTRIVGPRVTLRQLTPDDVDDVFEAAYASRFEISAWLPWCHADLCRSETEEFVTGRPDAWRRGEEYAYAIVESARGRLLGACGINQVDMLHRRANLGYWVRTDAAGQGVATEAARLLAPAALEDLALERVEIWAAVGNLASRRVAEKCGARFEGIARRRLRNRDRQDDAAGYAFIRADFGLPPLPGIA